MSLIKDVKNDFKKLEIDAAKLRTFAYVWVFIFGTSGLYSFYVKENQNTALAFFISTLAVVLIFFAWKHLFQNLFKGWMLLTLTIGWFVSRLILILLYFLVFTPISLISRAVGHRFLSQHKNRSTYWEPISFDTKPANYRRMF